MPIEFPITVKSIERKDHGPYRPELLFGGRCGDMVSVRPCGDEYGGKTFLGVLIGAIPIGLGIRYQHESGTLEVGRDTYNPAIFIPERDVVVFGCESWWGEIKSQEDLRQITDADIQDVWYVKALKALVAEGSASGEASAPE